MTLHIFTGSLGVCLSGGSFRLWFKDAAEAAAWLIRASVEQPGVTAIQHYYPTRDAPRLPLLPRREEPNK